MKKRFKIISLISSVFGVLGLSLAFALSCFDVEENIIPVFADGEMITITEGNGSLNTTSNYNADYIFTIEYNYVYYKTYIDSEPKYRFAITWSNPILGVSDGVSVTDYPLNFGSNLYSVTWQYTMDIFYDTFDIHFDAIDYRAIYYGGVVIDTPRFDLDFRFVSGSVNLSYPGYLMYGYEYSYPIVGAGYEEVSIDGFFLPFTSIHIANTLEENNYQVGYSDGYTAGYNAGFTDGNNVGFNNAYEQGYEQGSQEASDSALQLLAQYYQDGYTAGYNAGYDTDDTVGSVFSGIVQIGLLPVNLFLGMLNFEVLGINISSFVSALISVALTIVVIRVIIGSKQ